MKPTREFCAFILTHGRPDRVLTYEALRKAGYTGQIRLIVDDLDASLPAYQAKYGAEVVVFDKRAIAKTFDQADNFDDMRAIIYARNASFEIAKRLGFVDFVQLDDDYTQFYFKFDNELKFMSGVPIKRLGKVFELMVRFLHQSGAQSVALAQGGDYPEGAVGERGRQGVMCLRKCMNSFFCTTDRPFSFIGRVNEDVNTYSLLASRGVVFLTTTQVCLQQMQTQKQSGGMTELYKASGTYLKSWYSVMLHPSSIRIRMLKAPQSHEAGRLHHNIKWRYTVPKIVAEKFRKS